jgi:hypothetical protein
MLCAEFDKTWRLYHVHIFFEYAIEERCENIELVDRPVEMHGDSDENANCFPTDYGGEGFNEIDTVSLFKASGNKSSFEASGFAVNAGFELKNPS